MSARLPESVTIRLPARWSGHIFWADHVSDDWLDVRSELEVAFATSQEAARGEESIVYIVAHDDLLGRNGPGRAMVATGLLSAARTAAIEGSRKDWTANVVAHDDATDHQDVIDRALRLLGEHDVTGELVRLGPGHLGKALP